jgi:hypothetical protein
VGSTSIQKQSFSPASAKPVFTGSVSPWPDPSGKRKKKEIWRLRKAGFPLLAQQLFTGSEKRAEGVEVHESKHSWEV